MARPLRLPLALAVALVGAVAVSAACTEDIIYPVYLGADGGVGAPTDGAPPIYVPADAGHGALAPIDCGATLPFQDAASSGLALSDDGTKLYTVADGAVQALATGGACPSGPSGSPFGGAGGAVLAVAAANGHVWVGTTTGARSYRTDGSEEAICLAATSDVPAVPITGIAATKDGAFAIGPDQTLRRFTATTLDGGTGCATTTAELSFTAADGSSHTVLPLAITTSSDGGLWLAFRVDGGDDVRIGRVDPASGAIALGPFSRSFCDVTSLVAVAGTLAVADVPCGASQRRVALFDTVTGALLGGTSWHDGEPRALAAAPGDLAHVTVARVASDQMLRFSLVRIP